jgi:hypothetical protein
VIGALVALLPAAAFIALGRWGLRNLETFVSVSATAQRRVKDERSFRRGARSCFALGTLFALFAVFLAVSSVASTS